MGSVFSPYYAAARRTGPADPLQHCAMNVALYGQRGKRWTMTERRATSLVRTTDRLAIGPSAMSWDGSALVIEIDEISMPLPRRMRGRVKLYPGALPDQVVELGSGSGHFWRAIAPGARVEVQFTEPDLNWSGAAYLDSNYGPAPLETAFRSWTWSRAELPDGSSLVTYDVVLPNGDAVDHALHFLPAGEVVRFTAPPVSPLTTTGWRIARAARCDTGHEAIVERTLEDTPFYARSIVQTRLLAQPVRAVHEALSLDRFASRWVQCLLPFRMPRALR